MDRRMFFKSMLGGTALSVAALTEANAAIYSSLKALNQKHQQSPDGVYWDGVRKHYLFENDLVMMNNGTVGPMPEPVYNELMKAFKVQVTCPVECYTYLSRSRAKVRAKVEQFIGADPGEVAIVRNTTEGMNFFANGLEMNHGDEVIITNHEHPAGLHPWGLKAKRYGITIKTVDLGVPSKSVDEIVESIKKAITPRTKVISLSHTIYITGLIAPMKEISELAHKKDILVLADSAHGFGMLNLNMKELGIDAWCTSPYKWGGAPPEAGIYYVRKEVHDRLWPTTASSGWDSRKDATKFETLSQRADPLIIALGEAIEFQNVITKRRISRRIQTLGSTVRDRLDEIPEVKLHLPKDPYLASGLTAFSIKGVDPQYIVDYLREKYNIVVRTIGREKDGSRGVRVSTNIFIADEHVDMLVEGVKNLAEMA